MNYLLFKLLGIPTDHAGRIVGANIGLRGDFPIGWLVVLAAALAAGVFFLYRHTPKDISLARKMVLATLRSLFLALLLVLFAGPVLSLTYADSARQSLLMLFDVSDSMSLKDFRAETADQTRAAIAAGVADPSGGLNQTTVRAKPEWERPARDAVLTAALKNEKLNLLKRLAKDYDLAAFSFDRELREVAMDTPAADSSEAKPPAAAANAWIDRLVPQATTQPTTNPSLGTASATALGDSIRDAIYRKRGQLLAGMVIATDGGNNYGSSPVEAAKLAKDEGVPLYIYGVGVSNPRDIIGSNMFVQQVAFVRDELPLTVHVRSQGLKGQTAQLVLKLGDQKVDEKAITFGEDSDTEVALKFTPDRVGEFDLVASIAPRPDEVSQTNNTTTRHIRVVDGRIRVLQIEQQPRFEFKFLQVQLLRDRRVDYKCLLLDGDPGIAEGPKTPYLAKFPETLEDLAKYDLIIFGDIDPRRLPDDALANISQFVARFGGSLVMIAGHHFTPAAYHHTPIEDMLPIEFDPEAGTGIGGAVFDRPIHLELTDKGKDSPILRLAEKREENLAQWAKVPPIFWDYRVLRPKSLAEVLLVDGDVTKASRFGKMPVLALQGYGVGQVLWIGTDEIWRFRKGEFAPAYLTFWGQTIQRLSLAHMLGASKRTQLHANNEEYATGERIAIQARLYNSQLVPLSTPTVKGFMVRKGAAAGTQTEITLRQLPGQDGLYRAEFVAPAPGAYRFNVETDPDTSLDFSVIEPNIEHGQTAMNESLLRAMAQISGGAFFREEDLAQLPEQVHHTAQPIYSTAQAELAFSPLFFLLLMAALTAEWILRKVAQLR